MKTNGLDLFLVGCKLDTSSFQLVAILFQHLQIGKSLILGGEGVCVFIANEGVCECVLT